MRIGKLERVLNKWQFLFEIRKASVFGLSLLPYIYFVIANFHAFPDEGEVPTKGKHYKGIYWFYHVGNGFNITMKRITIRMGKNHWRQFTFPIKITFHK